MATASDRRDTSVRPPGVKYPWDQWQNGQWWTIEQGTDFSTTVKGMRDQLHTRGKHVGRRVKTHTDRATKITFTFQKDGESESAFERRAAAGTS